MKKKEKIKNNMNLKRNKKMKKNMMQIKVVKNTKTKVT